MGKRGGGRVCGARVKCAGASKKYGSKEVGTQVKGCGTV